MKKCTCKVHNCVCIYVGIGKTLEWLHEQKQVRRKIAELLTQAAGF